MSDLDSAIWEKYKDEGLLIYGIHPGEPPKELADFIEQTGVTFPIVADKGTKSMFDYAPGVGYPYPRDVVIGKDTTVRSIKNSFDVKEMEALIKKLLAE